jgi:hypothetical protein
MAVWTASREAIGGYIAVRQGPGVGVEETSVPQM